MKFIEYAALNNQLEKDGTSFNELVKETTGTSLNELYEADKEKEIETSRAGKGFHSPKFVIKRKKLNNLAKQFLKNGKTKVIEKYAPKILGSTQKLISRAAALASDGKNLDEINEMLGKEIKKAMEIQDKSITRLDNVIDKLGAGFEKRAKQLISKGLSEKSQNQLDMYWSLLELQVRQALDKNLVKYREKLIDSTVENNEELANMIKRMWKGTNWKQRTQELKDDVEKQEKEYQAKQKEAEKEGGDEEGEEKKVFKVGQVYHYKDKDGNDDKLKITKVKENGDIVGDTENKKNIIAVKKRIGKKINDSEEKTEEKPEKTEA